MAIRVLITAGGTSEKIDNVRRITNSGTGRLGALVCEAFAASGEDCRITYICSANAVRPHMRRDGRVTVHMADDVQTLRDTVEQTLREVPFDVIIHSMAVGDYTVRAVTDAKLMTGGVMDRIEAAARGDSAPAREAVMDGILAPPRIRDAKISSDKENLIIVLEKAPKIIAILRALAPEAVIVGFKLMSDVSEEELIGAGRALLEKNDCDFVLANDMRTVRTDRHEGVLLSRAGGAEKAFGKGEIAGLIVRCTIERVLRK
ncbi:MAG: phosphopantothenate--cysteine ligase [Clostridiales Family XIII bacterium]|jgi:phosphopantothenate-cysteine ligase|nr:phosphopantothenate--cysteine ligase [Clostridiales Family XIII bacterium]